MTPDSFTDRDERLAAAVESLLADASAGRTPDVESAAAANPDIALEIRELYATAMLAEEFGSLSGDETDSMDRELRTMQRPEIVGNYELLDEIGRGGMGVVFRARQRSLDRIVAVKLLLHGEFSSSDNVARFRAEAEAAAQLLHPNIVPVHEVGEENGQPYFSMDFVEGTTLTRRIAEGTLTARETAEILAQVCDAIAAAHARGVLHRDLKPSNVLIDRSGRAYVTDFGLAKRIEPTDGGTLVARGSLTDTGAILGTPGYMAPEQAAGRHGDLGPATDVYALGAVLYACLVGRPPFQAASPVESVLAVLEQDPVPPRVLARGVDGDLEMIALKCLQKPIDLRYPNVNALGSDLRSYLSGEPVAARSSRFSDVLVRWFRETHHAAVLENWGLLWMWHSLVLLVVSVVTNVFEWQGVENRWLYAGFWGIGMSVWAGTFWSLRKRSGPITFVERQIAHVWAGSVVCSVLLYWVEGLLDLQPLTLSPVLGLISGSVFLAKAGILTGSFYVQAVVLFATGVVMAAMQAASPQQNFALALFGVVAGACFFVPGLKYHRQSRRRPLRP